MKMIIRNLICSIIVCGTLLGTSCSSNRDIMKPSSFKIDAKKGLLTATYKGVSVYSSPISRSAWKFPDSENKNYAERFTVDTEYAQFDATNQTGYKSNEVAAGDAGTTYINWTIEAKLPIKITNCKVLATGPLTAKFSSIKPIIRVKIVKDIGEMLNGPSEKEMTVLKKTKNEKTKIRAKMKKMKADMMAVMQIKGGRVITDQELFVVYRDMTKAHEAAHADNANNYPWALTTYGEEKLKETLDCQQEGYALSKSLKEPHITHDFLKASYSNRTIKHYTETYFNAYVNYNGKQFINNVKLYEQQCKKKIAEDLLKSAEDEVKKNCKQMPISVAPTVLVYQGGFTNDKYGKGDYELKLSIDSAGGITAQRNFSLTSFKSFNAGVGSASKGNISGYKLDVTIGTFVAKWTNIWSFLAIAPTFGGERISGKFSNDFKSYTGNWVVHVAPEKRKLIPSPQGGGMSLHYKSGNLDTLRKLQSRK